MGNQGSKASSHGQWRLWTACAHAQDDKSLHWAYMQTCRKCCSPARHYLRNLRYHHISTYYPIKVDSDGRNTNKGTNKHLNLLLQLIKKKYILVPNSRFRTASVLFRNSRIFKVTSLNQPTDLEIRNMAKHQDSASADSEHYISKAHGKTLILYPFILRLLQPFTPQWTDTNVEKKNISLPREFSHILGAAISCLFRLDWSVKFLFGK